MAGSGDGASAAGMQRGGFVGAAIAVLAVSLLVSLGAGSAGAVVAKIGGQGYGITPVGTRNEASLLARAGATGSGAHAFDEPPFGGSQLVNLEGGPVMHSVTTHVVYWDPSQSEFTSTTTGIVDGFFTDVAHDSGLPTNVFGVAAQYTDSAGHAAYSSTFGGALTDSNPYPTSGNCTTPNEVDKGPYATCLFDEQLQHELAGFIEERTLPTGPTQLYFVLLPHNVATCLNETVEGKLVCSNNFYCAYHSYIDPGSPEEIIYADIPFSLLDSNFAKGCQSDGNGAIQLPNGDKGTSNTETRFADVALKYLSHEYIEAVTDPLVNFDTAWVDARGREIGDKCNSTPGAGEEGFPELDENAFRPTLGGTAGTGTLFDQSIGALPGHYYLQSQWDNAGKACLMRPLALSEATLAVPAATAGSPARFSAGANDPYHDFQPAWSFGDGGTAVGPSPSHTYAAAGQYTVTMTPEDGLTGSTASAVGSTITVAPAPTGTAPTPPESSASATSTALTSTTSSSTPALAPPAPDSAFVARTGTLNAATGAIAFSESVDDPGTLSWLATFANGRFGAFASSRCKEGLVKLAGKCRPAKIVFATGRRSVPDAGTVSFTLKPSASAERALKNALKKDRGVPVSVALSFSSSRGGAAVTHILTIVAKLKK